MSKTPIRKPQQKTYFLAAAIFCGAIMLTACPAPTYDFVVINRSEKPLEVEYEYVFPDVKYDSSELTRPARMSLAVYEEGRGDERKWQELAPEKEYSIASREEAYVVKMQGSGEEKAATRKVNAVRLRLAPGEVLRVLNSTGINADAKGVRRLSLRGDGGKLEIEGEGFRQFDPYRPPGFMRSVGDYRIVYGGRNIYD